jgi:Na+/melibiose symporter-like transporter
MQQKLTVVTKTAYGIGQLAEGLKNTSFELFVFFYYNQVLGLSGTLTGLATFMALACDSVTDPMTGSISDNFRHRWGRRHPFIYVAAVPLGVAFALLFRPPAGIGEIGLFLWLMVFSILTRTAMTVYHVPHLALGAELSADYRERTTIVAYRTLFQVIGAAVAAVVGLGVFFKATDLYPNGQLNPTAYPPYAFFCGIVMVVTVLISAAGTHRRIPMLRQLDHEPEPFSMRRVWGELREALSNESFRALFVGIVIFFVMRGVQMSLGLHMGTYFWGLTTEQILFINMILIAGLIVGVPFWTVVARGFDKKPTFLLGVCCFTVFNAAPPLLRIAGLFPQHIAEEYVPLLLGFAFLAAFGGAAGLVTAGSMMADIADEHELKTGRRQEGIFFGALAFAGKSASGLGHQVAGLGIDAIGFPMHAVPGQVPHEVINRLGILFGPGIAIFAVISIFFLARYRLNRGAHEQIVEKLEARRTAAAARHAAHGVASVR